jgi:hypothetical protein
MGRTVRVTDEAFEFMRKNQKPEENDQDTISRLIKSQITSESQPITESTPKWVTELKRDILKEVKTAIESALAR